jgi:hypothetical protein
MAPLVIRVVGNILGLIPIGNLKASRVACRRRINPAEFGILLPKIGFDQFGSGKKLEDRNIAS